jgi:hypothetical protein
MSRCCLCIGSGGSISAVAQKSARVFSQLPRDCFADKKNFKLFLAALIRRSSFIL